MKDVASSQHLLPAEAGTAFLGEVRVGELRNLFRKCLVCLFFGIFKALLTLVWLSFATWSEAPAEMWSESAHSITYLTPPLPSVLTAFWVLLLTHIL